MSELGDYELVALRRQNAELHVALADRQERLQEVMATNEVLRTENEELRTKSEERRAVLAQLHELIRTMPPAIELIVQHAIGEDNGHPDEPT